MKARVAARTQGVLTGVSSSSRRRAWRRVSGAWENTAATGARRGVDAIAWRRPSAAARQQGLRITPTIRNASSAR